MSNVRVYGADHSPWVQAVMLGLHAKQIPHTRSTVPTPEGLLTWGIMMPQASFDGEPWDIESKDILHRMGYAEVSDEDMRDIKSTWRGVMHRVDVWPRFWGEFSIAGDPDPSFFMRLLKNFFRSFVTLYFFLLINFSNLVARRPEPESYGDQYLKWEERFAAMSGPFLGGDEPDAIDLLLFGMVQCHCSIPVPPLTALQADPRLVQTRKWIGEMQEHFSDYPSLYSSVYFEPHAAPPEKANGLDQLAFWLGAVFMLTFFWITVPLVAVLAYRNRKLR